MSFQCSVVSFDFDGTLVLSNRIKREGFLALASEYEDGRPLMQEILLRPDAGNRYSIFSCFCRQLNLPGSELPAQLAGRYGLWCEQQIVVAPSRSGADELLAALSQAGVPLYICSATPHAALCSIVNRRYPSGLFSGLFGDPCSKQDALHQILELEDCRPESLLHVGDSADDQQAAVDVGCQFIPVAGHGLDQGFDPHHGGGCVDDLMVLIAQLGLAASASPAASEPPDAQA